MRPPGYFENFTGGGADINISILNQSFPLLNTKKFFQELPTAIMKSFPVLGDVQKLQFQSTTKSTLEVEDPGF